MQTVADFHDPLAIRGCNPSFPCGTVYLYLALPALRVLRDVHEQRLRSSLNAK